MAKKLHNLIIADARIAPDWSRREFDKRYVTLLSRASNAARLNFDSQASQLARGKRGIAGLNSLLQSIAIGDENRRY
jgi:hypothetical protein